MAPCETVCGRYSFRAPPFKKRQCAHVVRPRGDHLLPFFERRGGAQSTKEELRADGGELAQDPPGCTETLWHHTEVFMPGDQFHTVIVGNVDHPALRRQNQGGLCCHVQNWRICFSFWSLVWEAAAKYLQSERFPTSHSVFEKPLIEKHPSDTWWCQRPGKMLAPPLSNM